MASKNIIAMLSIICQSPRHRRPKANGKKVQDIEDPINIYTVFCLWHCISRKSSCARMGPTKLVGAHGDFSAAFEHHISLNAHKK